MMRGMFSAVSGLKTQQVMLDVAANDLANVNTVGYKAARTTFKDQLQQLVRTSSASGAGFGGANAAQIGLGVHQFLIGPSVQRHRCRRPDRRPPMVFLLPQARDPPRIPSEVKRLNTCMHHLGNT